MPTVPEPPVPVLEIAKPELNCEGVSRLRLRFQNRWFSFGFEQVVFYDFFTVLNRQFFAVPAWFHDFSVVFSGFGLNHPEPAVTARFCGKF